MRTAIVEANKISTKSLRASDYVANLKRMADTVVSKWSKEFGGVINTKSSAGRRLVFLVEVAIREGMKKK